MTVTKYKAQHPAPWQTVISGLYIGPTGASILVSQSPARQRVPITGAYYMTQAQDLFLLNQAR